MKAGAVYPSLHGHPIYLGSQKIASLVAGEEIEHGGKCGLALVVGFDEELVPGTLDPQRFAPFAGGFGAKCILRCVVHHAVVAGLQQQQRRLDGARIGDGGIGTGDPLINPVGGGPSQLDLRVLLINLAESLIAGLAVSQLVIGKAMILIGALTRPIGWFAKPAADRAYGGSQPLGQPFGQAAQIDAQHGGGEHGGADIIRPALQIAGRDGPPME